MKNKLFYGYWIFSCLFVVLFGEIIGPLIAGHALPILAYPIPFIIYYLIISLVFAFIINKNWFIALIVFFLYGFIVELLLFKNISGFTDIPGILFFGFFYVFLFGTPRYIYRKIFKK
jgi:hypothetical protein